MPISLYAQDKVMDSLLASPFISLHSKSPNSLGESELMGEGYKRVNASDLFHPSKGGEKVSLADVSFKELPESSVTHIGIWDSEIEGNFLWSAELDEKQQIHRGNTFTLPAGQLVFGLS